MDKCLQKVRYKILYTFKTLAHLPKSVRRKIENGFRTCYSLSLMFLLFNYWSWSGSLTFFSGIISIIGHTLYLGQWIDWILSDLCATFLGASLGTLCAFTWKIGSYGSLQLFLMFISLTMINRIEQ